MSLLYFSFERTWFSIDRTKGQNFLLLLFENFQPIYKKTLRLGISYQAFLWTACGVLHSCRLLSAGIGTPSTAYLTCLWPGRESWKAGLSCDAEVARVPTSPWTLRMFPSPGSFSTWSRLQGSHTSYMVTEDSQKHESRSCYTLLRLSLRTGAVSPVSHPLSKSQG